MPDGRFLSKSVAYSHQLGQVSFEADYLFTRLIPHCDREGRMPGAVLTVKGMCVPLRAEMTPDIIERALGELAAVGLIQWYAAEGDYVIQLPNFAKHQHGARLDRERPSRFAPPPPDSGELRRTPASGGDVRLSEVKRSEVKPSEVPSVAAAPGKAKPASVKRAPDPFDLAPYIDIAREERGECDPPAARWGKAFKRLERRYGAEEVQRRWRNALRRKGEFATPEDLGTNWAAHDVAALPTRASAPALLATRARVLLRICRTFSLFDMPTATREQNAARVELASHDAEAGPAFRDELARIRPWSELTDVQDDDAVVAEFVRRLAAPAPASRGGDGLARAGALLAQLRELRQEQPIPGQGTSRYIRKDDIRAQFGDSVLGAVEAIGGPARILDTPAEKWGLLVRDFAGALAHAGVAA